MPTLAWIVVAGLAMSALALVGTITVLMPARTLARVLLPMVGLAAGSLLGGAFFHMLPESVDAIGNRLGVYLAVVAGFLVFFVLEQFCTGTTAIGSSTSSAWSAGRSAI
jgi:zinc and cadmium transporter